MSTSDRSLDELAVHLSASQCALLRHLPSEYAREVRPMTEEDHRASTDDVGAEEPSEAAAEQLAAWGFIERRWTTSVDSEGRIVRHQLTGCEETRPQTRRGPRQTGHRVAVVGVRACAFL